LLNQIVRKHSESANLSKADTTKDEYLVHVWLQTPLTPEITLTIFGFKYRKIRDGHSVWYHFVDIRCLGPCSNVLRAGSKQKFQHTILHFPIIDKILFNVYPSETY